MEITTKTNTSNAEMVTIPRAEYESMQAQLDWLMEQMRLAKKKAFGASSEKSHEELTGQMNFLFDEAELHLEIERKEEASAPVAGYMRKKRSGDLDEILPENVPVEVVEHRLPEVQAGWHGNAHLKDRQSSVCDTGQLCLPGGDCPHCGAEVCHGPESCRNLQAQNSAV